MAYSYSLHNIPLTYCALEKTKPKQQLSVNTVLFFLLSCSLLSTSPWKVSVCLGEPTTEVSQLQRDTLSSSSHSTSKTALLSFGKDESIWHVWFQSYKEFLLVVLCSVCGAGPRCLRGAARSSVRRCFAPSRQPRPVLGGQGSAGPGPGPGGRRLQEAAPQGAGEVAQRAAAAAGVPHGQPGVHVGLCSAMPAALRERSLQPPARLPAQRWRFPARPGCCHTGRRAEGPLEVTAGLLGGKGSTWVRFCFTLQSSDLPAPPPSTTLLYRERGWDTVLQDFSTACIITLLGKPDVCFKGLGAVWNLLKVRENPVNTQFYLDQ